MRRESALTHRGKIGGVRWRSFRIQIRKRQTLESRIGDLEREKGAKKGLDLCGFKGLMLVFRVGSLEYYPALSGPYANGQA